MLNQELVEAFEWAYEQAGLIDHGCILISIIRHGDSTRLETTVTKKQLLNDGGSASIEL